MKQEPTLLPASKIGLPLPLHNAGSSPKWMGIPCGTSALIGVA